MAANLRERVPAAGPEPVVSPAGSGGGAQLTPRSVSSSSDGDEAAQQGGVFASLASLVYRAWAPVDRLIGAGIVPPPNEAVSAG